MGMDTINGPFLDFPSVTGEKNNEKEEHAAIFNSPFS